MAYLAIPEVVLMVSVAWLARSVHRYTGKKHNSDLIYWHIINVLVFIILFAIGQVSLAGYISADE